MRRSYALALLLVVPSFTFARSYPIAAEVQRLRAAGAAQRSFTVLKAIDAPADAPFRKVMDRGTLADIDPVQLGTLVQEHPGFIRMAFPFHGGELAVDLYRVDPFAEGFTVRTDRGVFNGYRSGVYYRGIIAGDPTSVAAFSFFPDQVIGMASSSALGNVVVERMVGKSRDHHIIYSDADLLVERSVSCGTRDLPQVLPHPAPAIGGEARTTKCVRLYYELAFDVYQFNGSDLTQSVNWATAAHNNVATLFANDDIQVSLSEVFVWTEQEHFMHQSDQFDVDRFAEYRSAFNGDVANFISSQFGAGYARGIGGICSQGAYETSPVIVFEEVPTFSWMVPIITHEIGHVCGSQHTHACVWNDNNTQIDDCGHNDPVGYYENIACYDSLNPILPIGHGTIMSYCGPDLTLGFGPQPRERIREHIEAAPCLGSDCILSCSPSLDSLMITQITPYSALLSFHDLNTTTTEWEVQVFQDSQPFIAWTTFTTQSFTLTPLSPDHLYTVNVRSHCAEPFSSNLIYSRQFTTPTTECGHQFFDAGGIADPYLCDVPPRTFVPDVIGNKVRLIFTAFDMEPGQDLLVIHNGPDENAPVLGSFTGNTIPGPVTSTAPGGELTVVVQCDQQEFNPYNGWGFTVSCIPGTTTGINDPDDVDAGFQCHPNPANDRTTVEYTLQEGGHVRLSLLDLQGRLVRVLSDDRRGAGPQQAMFDVSGLAEGCYTLRLEAGGQSRSIRLMK